MTINSYTETHTHLMTQTIPKQNQRKQTLKKPTTTIIAISEIIYNPYITAITINS